MTASIVLNEKALLYLLKCPARSNRASPLKESPVLVSAENTASWLIDELRAGRTPTATKTRDFFDAEWQQTAYFQSQSSIPIKEYERCLREGVRACRRLRDILYRCEILQPPSAYTLQIGGVAITGEYAVLRSSRRKKHAFALYLRYQGVRLKRLVPDVVSFVRRLDLEKRWTDPANRYWRVESIGVMHYWVSRDLSAEHITDREFATDVLLGAVGVVTGAPFPVPGEQCRLCPTRACRPDDLVGPSDTRH